MKMEYYLLIFLIGAIDAKIANNNSFADPSLRIVDTRIKLVVPPIVNISDTIKISCAYDSLQLNKQSHQSVVLYRNNEEFYKFDADKGQTIYSIPYDLTASVHQTDNSTEVTFNANKSIEGEYSCGLSSYNTSQPKYLLVREQTSSPVLISMPKIAVKGQTVPFICSFNINKNNLESVTWFKEDRKIYQYHHHNEANEIVTQIEGIGQVEDITSEENKDFLSIIQIKNITSNISGNYTCEVKTNNQQTYRDSASMALLHLPKEEPTLFIESDYLRNGDLIKTLCSSGPSYPLATITWYIDGVKISDLPFSMDQKYDNFPYPAISTINERVHFKKGVSNITVSCVVTIGSWYKKKKSATIHRTKKLRIYN